MKPLILVLGVGRSGTSTVARVLHERWGVCFGHRFHAPNVANPQGWFEDLNMEKPVQRLLMGVITPEQWLCDLEAAHEGCDAPYWGVKWPEMCMCPRRYLLRLKPMAIVRTYRPRELAVPSLAMYRGRGEGKYAEQMWDVREEALGESLWFINQKGIRFENVCFWNEQRRSDDEVAMELEGVFG